MRLRPGVARTTRTPRNPRSLRTCPTRCPANRPTPEEQPFPGSERPGGAPGLSCLVKGQCPSDARGSVLRLVDELARADPGHHAAQLLADFLDLVGVVVAAGRLEEGLTDGVLGHEVPHEGARLDVGKNVLHARFRLVVGEHALAGDVFSV